MLDLGTSLVVGVVIEPTHVIYSHVRLIDLHPFFELMKRDKAI